MRNAEHMGGGMPPIPPTEESVQVDPAVYQEEVDLQTGKTQEMDALPVEDTEGENIPDTEAAPASKEAEKSVTDLGKARAEALGKKLSSVKRGMGSFFGGMMGKLKDIGSNILYGALAPDLMAKKVGHAASEGGKTVGRGFKAADQAIDRGLEFVGKKAFEGVKTVGRAAKDVGEIALVGSAALGLGALEAGNKHIFQPSIEKTGKTWGGLMERGRSMIDSLSAKKNKAVEDFIKWRLSSLLKTEEKRRTKLASAETATQEARQRLEAIRGQRATLEMLDSVEPEEEAVGA